MSTPIETAAEAVIAADLLDRYVEHDAEDIAWDATRAVLDSLAHHRDDIARALWQHDVSQTPWEYASDAERALYLSMADAVLAYLTGEAS